VALFGLLLETNARLSKDFDAELEAQCQMPLAWFDVLLQLRNSADGRLKMSQMADAIVHSTGGTTRLVDRLQEAGFVRREHCANDRRAVYVSITEAGSAKLDQALAVHLRHLDDNLAARLSDDERAQLTALLTKLNAPR
jgi:DNA-binding MarR family transcriptional regulator